MHSLERVHNTLADVAKRLETYGITEAITRIQNNHHTAYNVISPAFEKLQETEERLERQAEVEPWGAWAHLPLAKRLVLEPEKIQAEVRAEAEADPQIQVTAINFFGVAGEMEKIRSGEIDDDSIVYFRAGDYRKYAQRIHNHVTQQLLTSKTEFAIPEFDQETSTLYFAGNKIIISQRAQSDAHELLQTIFKDTHKTWHNDEILDDWKFDVRKKAPKKKIYHAGKAVNRIVAQHTTVQDFLIVTTKNISINVKYLKK